MCYPILEHLGLKLYHLFTVFTGLLPVSLCRNVGFFEERDPLVLLYVFSAWNGDSHVVEAQSVFVIHRNHVPKEYLMIPVSG